MKKFAIAILSALSFGAFAADYVSVDIDYAVDRAGSKDSTVQYIRAGKHFGDYLYRFQGRTATLKNNSAISSSVEATVENTTVKFAGIVPFVGVGHNNNAGYNYGVVGATYGLPVGPGYLLTGVKTRVGSTQDVNRTKVTLGYAAYFIPVTKDVNFNLTVSRSVQDIKEDAYGIGLSFNF